MLGVPTNAKHMAFQRAALVAMTTAQHVNFSLFFKSGKTSDSFLYIYFTYLIVGGGIHMPWHSEVKGQLIESSSFLKCGSGS